MPMNFTVGKSVRSFVSAAVQRELNSVVGGESTVAPRPKGMDRATGVLCSGGMFTHRTYFAPAATSLRICPSMLDAALVADALMAAESNGLSCALWLMSLPPPHRT